MYTLSKSYVLSLIVLSLVFTCCNLLPSFLGLLVKSFVSAYCIFEQVDFYIRRGKIPGPIIIPPIVGFICESLSPKMADYANLSKRGSISATKVFNKFIVLCTEPSMVKQIFTENKGIIQLCLVDSMKKILSPDNFVFTFGNLHKGQKANFIGIFGRKNLARFTDRQVAMYKHFLLSNNNVPIGPLAFKWLNLHTFFEIFLGDCLKPIHHNNIAADLECITSALQLVNFPLALPGTAVWKAIRARKRIVAIFKQSIETCRQQVKKDNLIYQLVHESNVDDEELAMALFAFIFASQDALTSGVTWIMTRLANNQELQSYLARRQDRDDSVNGKETKQDNLYQQSKLDNMDNLYQQNNLDQQKEQENGKEKQQNNLDRQNGKEKQQNNLEQENGKEKQQNNLEQENGKEKQQNNLEQDEKQEAIESMVKESLRTRPSVIMVPHILTEAYNIGGYLVPSGTIIIPSIWAMAHHKDYYENPEEFNPRRFMPNKENFANSLAFGLGQHSCLGYNYTLQHSQSLGHDYT